MLDQPAVDAVGGVGHAEFRIVDVILPIRSLPALRKWQIEHLPLGLRQECLGGVVLILLALERPDQRFHLVRELVRLADPAGTLEGVGLLLPDCVEFRLVSLVGLPEIDHAGRVGVTCGVQTKLVLAPGLLRLQDLDHHVLVALDHVECESATPARS